MTTKFQPMYVIKRNGKKEPMMFDKISNRISKLNYNLEGTDPTVVTQKVASRIFSGIHTKELDEIASQTCMAMVIETPDYGILGARITISNHQKNTSADFVEVLETLYNNVDILNENSPLISSALLELGKKYKDAIEKLIDYTRDYNLDYFGFKTLEKSYLLKLSNGKIIERPQHLYLRVAFGIHGDNWQAIEDCYHNLSQQNYTYATPTLFNAGTNKGQLASCFLLGIEDSLEGILKCYHDVSTISKHAGGIGVHISNIRSKGAYIRGTGGFSNGLMPLLRTFNSLSRQFDQSGRRNGSFALYLEPHHPDILIFLEAKRNQGVELERARDLFYALWVSDLFMECVRDDADWYLLDPDRCKGLNEVYGDEYKELYKSYVDKGMFVKKVKARDIFSAVVASQIETGNPYFGYKDSFNRKSNQKNIGVIKSSNLCVAGDTMILTSEGYYPIKELVDQEVEVWNGSEWSKTTVKQTGTDQKLLTVQFSNGMSIRCTPYHKFHIETGSRPNDNSKPEIVEAKDLKLDMRIIKYNLGIVNDNKKEMKYPYTHGFFCGDGTYYRHKNNTDQRCKYKVTCDTDFCRYHKYYTKDFETDDGRCCATTYTKTPVIALYGPKKDLIPYLDHISEGKLTSQDRITIALPKDIDEKFFVPINYSLNTKLRWLEGLLDADGCTVNNNGCLALQISSIHKQFLIEISYLLQTLGVFSNIGIMSEERKTLLPDGKGGKKYFDCKMTWRMCIPSQSVFELVKMGFNPKRLNLEENHEPRNKCARFIRITGLSDEDDIEDTFCFNEPKEHKGIFNGIVTGQCHEIALVSDPTKGETATCNLASISLPSCVSPSPFTEQFQMFKGLASDKKLLILTTPDCTYCKLLKGFVKQYNLTHTEIDLHTAKNFLLHSTGSEKFETYPQVFEVPNETEFDLAEIKHIGGYTETWHYLKPEINHKKLQNLAFDLAIGINKVIDVTYYPTEDAKRSNLRHRPLGIGVQGLADVFFMLKVPYGSPEAKKLNKEIFETIYYGAVRASLGLALCEGAYSSFEGSPISEGKFQFDLWGLKKEELSGRYDWDEMRERVKKYGVRNSTLIALMPTASTSQIMGNTESFEMLTSNVYSRRTQAGEFTIVNKFLLQDLIDLDIWNEDTRDRLIYDRGSVQNIKTLPKFLRDVYKTVWETSQKDLIEMSAQRGPFVCQSQSLNLYFDNPNFTTLLNAHFYGWKLGLKTGSYYIRTKPGGSAQRFGLDITKEKKLADKEEEEGCLNCSA